MTAPFVLITTHTVRHNGLDDLTELSRRYERHIAEEEPDLLAFHAHMSEDGREVSFVHVLADSASAEHHMQVAGPLIGEGLLRLPTVRAEVYGIPGPVLREAFEGNAAAGAAISTKSVLLNGFSRIETLRGDEPAEAR